MIYYYSNVTSEPDLDALTIDVQASLMTDKNLKHFTWDEEGSILEVHWDNALDASNKQILDDIVEAGT